jgi:hypothetical protein
VTAGYLFWMEIFYKQFEEIKMVAKRAVKKRKFGYLEPEQQSEAHRKTSTYMKKYI